MNPDHAPTLIQIGGYVLSLLLGGIVFLMKRELSRNDDAIKALRKDLTDQSIAIDAKLVEVRNKLDAHSNADKEKWEAHRDRHDELHATVQAKHDDLNEAVQEVRTDLLHHCAEASEKYLTKDDFVASTTYLTKKTDEVSRLLQSIENMLARR